jgi:hypothetical protein
MGLPSASPWAFGPLASPAANDFLLTGFAIRASVPPSASIRPLSVSERAVLKLLVAAAHQLRYAPRLPDLVISVFVTGCSHMKSHKEAHVFRVRYSVTAPLAGEGKEMVQT